ncbi:hypothetical protein O1W71_04430 [Microbacterium sp. H37-C3]|uniref:hypothetical protein n=1 Tax=Microbacterium sp. H37-C3 TaxID=3004354 RepID=UPI0022B04587|nr:hypothetical protein [Microbacterium sp. H37-C3]MCZ4066909.1 hypothetical protein [Microbacterium sp. H37-C3]
MNRWGIALWAAVAAAAFGYCVLERPASSAGLHEELALGVLSTLTSPTFLAFVVTPLWLAYGVLDSRRTATLLRLIRAGSYSSHLRRICWRALRAILPPLLAVITGAAAAVVVDLGGQLDRDSTLIARVDDVGMPLAAAIGAQVALLGVFLMLTRMVLEMLALLSLHAVAVALSIAAWLWAAASATGVLLLGGLADFRAYTLVPALAAQPRMMGDVVLAYSVAIIGLTVAAAFLDRSARQNGISPPDWLLPSAAGALVALLAAGAFGARDTDLVGFLTGLYFGATGTMLQMLVAVILVVGYAFAAQFRMAQLAGPWGLVTGLRYGSRRRQLVTIISREFGHALTYSAVVLVAAVAAYFVAGGRTIVGEPGLMLLLFQTTVMQAIQITFYIACVACAVLISNKQVSGLVVIGVVTALAAVPIPASVVWVTQRASTAVLFDGGWAATIANALLLTAATCAVVLVATRRGPKTVPLLSSSPRKVLSR